MAGLRITEDVSGSTTDVELALAAAQSAVAPQLTVRLLGPFEVSAAGETVGDFRYAKVRALLAALVLSPGPMARSSLAGLLWPDHPETRARASLSQALTTLRRALAATHRDVIGADATRVWARLDRVEVDALTVRRLLDEADRHDHPRARSCRHCDQRRAEAVARVRGELLADVVTGSDLFDAWADEQRRRLTGRLVTAVSRTIERAEWAGRPARAVELARRLVELEPLVEAHRRQLVGLLINVGHAHEARVQLGALERMVREDLGAEPEPATAALAGQLRAGDRSSRPAPRRGRIPAPPGRLIGRADELTALTARLVDPATHVVTVTGTGGVGKTHLALTAARAVADHFDDGVVFVDLTGISDAAAVPNAIATAAELDERPHPDTTEAVLAELADRHMLVVFDNAEQVLDAAPLLGELAHRGVTVLVTSRTALGLRVEWNVVLQPLAPEHAAELLATRVTAAGGDLGDGPSRRADAAAICQRVDHLPLAIELVAARSRGRSLATLLAELTDPLTALVSTAGDVPPRHRTLRATIEWGLDLLDPATRRLFHRLGVFTSGWTNEAARAVAPDLDDVDQRLDVLVAANLVRPHDDRFTMLATFRDYARERLQDDPAAPAVRDRHAAHVADLATAAEIGLLGADSAAWAERLEAEQENLRSGFAWAMARGDTETAMRIAAGSWRYHWMRGLVREPLDRLLAVLDLPSEVPAALRTHAMRAAGLLALASGELTHAHALVADAVALARRAGDEPLLQLALANLGLVCVEVGELDAAVAALTESIVIARRIGGPRAKFPLGILAGAHVRRGDGERAAVLAAEGLRLNREAGDPEGTADALRTLATAVRLLDHRDCARRLAHEALDRHRTLGHELGVGLDLVVLGDLAADEGDRSGAAGHYRQTLAQWRRVANPIETARVLERLATVLVDDDPVTAAHLAGAAATARARTGAVPEPRHAAALAALDRSLAARLGAAAGAEALYGAALTLPDAIERAGARGSAGADSDGTTDPRLRRPRRR